MGNRGGALHNENREIVRKFATGVGSLAVSSSMAGSAPLWLRGFTWSYCSWTKPSRLQQAVPTCLGSRELLRASDIDAELHRTRVDSRGGKVTHEAALNSLPDGCFVHIEGAAYLSDDALLLWTPERYARKDRRPDHLLVTVLTPPLIVECFRLATFPLKIPKGASDRAGLCRSCLDC